MKAIYQVQVLRGARWDTLSTWLTASDAFSEARRLAANDTPPDTLRVREEIVARFGIPLEVTYEVVHRIS